jgi:hypothetical protein
MTAMGLVFGYLGNLKPGKPKGVNSDLQHRYVQDFYIGQFRMTAMDFSGWTSGQH